MKHLKLLMGVVIVATMVTSCKTAQPYTYSEYRSIEPTQSVRTAPLLADLQVSENRITYAEKINVRVDELSSLEIDGIVEKEKKTVIANAVKTHNADVLVATIVDVQTDAHWNLVITVTGYPAVYKNFHNATKDELWILEQPVPAQKEKASAIFSLKKK